MNHDGYISHDEVARYFSKTGLPRKVFEQLFLMCDCDKDGFLDETEFTYIGHIAYVHQSVCFLCVHYVQGVPLPRGVPKCLRQEKKEEEPAKSDSLDLDFLNEQPAEENMNMTLNIDLIPSAKNIFFDDDDDKAEKNTNPFAMGLEEAEREAEEAEQRRLEELQNANSVPAIVSDNRGKLQTIWKDNMQRWKSGDSRIQEQDSEIREKKTQNADIRREIERLQSKLGDYQEAIEAKGRVECHV